MIMNTTRLALAFVAGISAGTVQADDPGESQKKAALLYKTHCRSCHLVPDPGHERDRAWLDQVNRTA